MNAAMDGSLAVLGLSILSLNLHAFHPMGEAQRYQQDRQGHLEKADSDLFFYTPEELTRGHAKRIRTLSRDLTKLQPDIAFFQEVVAGGPESPKDCTTFENDRRQSARQLHSAVRSLGKDYALYLACRGNRGWWTTPETFREKRIVTRDADGTVKVVFDFDSNPYPDGMVVEGYAAFVDRKWRVLEHRAEFVTSNDGRSRAFVQLIRLARTSDPSQGWFMAANVHLGHKLEHFAQAVAIRGYLERRKSEWLNQAQSPFQGLIVTGDFNALLYRPVSRTTGKKLPEGEIAMIPWEVRRQGEFNYRDLSDTNWESLSRGLDALNGNRSYKPWATITDQPLARIDSALKEWGRLLPIRAMTEAMDEASRTGRCAQTLPVPFRCRADERIDHLFYDLPGSRVREAAVLYPENDWQNPSGVSDHPGILVRFSR